MRTYTAFTYHLATLSLIIAALVPNHGYSESAKVKPPRPHTQNDENTGERNVKKEEKTGEHSPKKDDGAPTERKASRQPSELPKKENNPSYNFTVQSAQRHWSSSGTVWNREYLNSPEGKRTRDALEAFDRRKIGNSVRDFDMTGMTSEQIKAEAIARGFEFKQEPLMDGKGNYIKKGPDGQNETKNANDPEIVPHDIYFHEDKGMIRVKPEGAPGTLRPSPHVSKSVRYSDVEFRDTSPDAECFKVTNRDLSVPKSPTPSAPDISESFKSDQQTRNRMDAIADVAHTNLKEIKR